jgi:hypothetical protein
VDSDDEEEERVSFTKNRSRSLLLLNPSLVVRPRSGKLMKAIKTGNFWKDSSFCWVEHDDLEMDQESSKFDHDNGNACNRSRLKDTLPDTTLQFSSSPAQYNLATAIRIVKHHSCESLETVSTDSYSHASNEEDEDSIEEYTDMDPSVNELSFESGNLVKNNLETHRSAPSDMETACVAATPPMFTPGEDATLCAVAKQAAYANRNAPVTTTTPSPERDISQQPNKQPSVDAMLEQSANTTDTTTKAETQSRSTVVVNEMPRTFLCSDMELLWILPVTSGEENEEGADDGFGWGHYPETLEGSGHDDCGDDKASMETMEKAADEVTFEDFVVNRQQKTMEQEHWREPLERLGHKDKGAAVSQASSLDPNFSSPSSSLVQGVLIVKTLGDDDESGDTATTAATTSTLMPSLEVLTCLDEFEVILYDHECFEMTNLQHIARSMKEKKYSIVESAHEAAVAREQYLLDTSWLNSMFTLTDDRNVDVSMKENGGQRHGHHYLCTINGRDTSLTVSVGDNLSDGQAFDVFCVEDKFEHQHEVIGAGVEVVGLAVQESGAVEV